MPSNGISWGSSGPGHARVRAATEERCTSIRARSTACTPQDTDYAVIAVEKLLGLQARRRHRPDGEARDSSTSSYTPAKPKAEGDRVEIDLDTQVLTVFKHWQPILITTTSTGSGEHFCGGADGCQYAITPAGHFHFYYLHRGWDKGKLGQMWNPYYFNGGIAVHGLASVPSYPASHGCARIPMDIANYFPTLVTKGESVYVVGTPMKPGNGYIGPAPTTTTTSTTVPKTSTTKAPHHARRCKHPTHDGAELDHDATTTATSRTTTPTT